MAAEITLPTATLPWGLGTSLEHRPPAQNSFSEQSWHTNLVFGVGDRVTHPFGVLGDGILAGGCKGWVQALPGAGRVCPLALNETVAGRTLRGQLCCVC